MRAAVNYSLEDAKDNPAAKFLEGMLSKMEIESSVLASVQEEEIRLRIDSDTMGILIGHRGETLDALQYLTSLVVNRNRKDEGFIRVTLDPENYRNKREETLQRLARKIASQVKATGKPRALEPMNPYERQSTACNAAEQSLCIDLLGRYGAQPQSDHIAKTKK